MPSKVLDLKGLPSSSFFSDNLRHTNEEIKLEWGMGLAKNREVEAELMELELEKDRPFARSSIVKSFAYLHLQLFTCSGLVCFVPFKSDEKLLLRFCFRFDSMKHLVQIPFSSCSNFALLQFLFTLLSFVLASFRLFYVRF
ncbi:hypothetical protein Csa_023490 [Cucumis sativus]|nr:hypothetical protein Csa_023490 [Cucumis sativus]